MKKSLLLSSIMALVLVIALSTATFAWYGSSNSATATMQTLEATSGAGNLQIKINDGTYGATATYTAPAGKYEPASILESAGTTLANWEYSAETNNWVMGSEDADNKNDLKKAEGLFLIRYDVWLKNAGAEEIKVKVNTETLGYAVNYDTTNETALQDPSEKLMAHSSYMIFDATGATATVYANSQYYTTKAIGDNQLADDTTRTAVAAKTPGQLTIAADGEVHLVVFNWIDGWKASSKAGNNSQKGKVKFNLDFVIDTQTV